MSNGNVVLTIYGKKIRKQDRKVEYVSEVISTEAPKKKFVAQTGAGIACCSEKRVGRESRQHDLEGGL